MKNSLAQNYVNSAKPKVAPTQKRCLFLTMFNIECGIFSGTKNWMDGYKKDFLLKIENSVYFT